MLTLYYAPGSSPMVSHHARRGRGPIIAVLFPVALLILTLSDAARARPAESVFSDTGPDAAAYGAAQGYPVPEPPAVRTPRQEEMVGWYSHYDRFRTMRTVPGAGFAVRCGARPRRSTSSTPTMAATAGSVTSSTATPSPAC